MVDLADASGARIRLEGVISAVDHPGRLEALLAFVAWMRRSGELVVGGEPAFDHRRLRLALTVLETAPDLRARFQAAVADVLGHTQAVTLISESGLPGSQGFLSEATSRLTARLLPEPHDHGDLAQILRRLFPGDVEVAALRSWDDELARRLVTQLAPADGADLWKGVRNDAIDGFRLLAVKVQSLGLARAVRERCTEGTLDESPFLRLGAASEALALSWRSGAVGARSEWDGACARCLAELHVVHFQVQDEGIGVEVVFAVAVIRLALERMRLIADVLDKPETDPTRLHGLVLHLAEACRRDRSLRHLAGMSLSLLHRRIVERSGETGEHYIAHDRAAYGRLWLAALGGGSVTVGTTAVKLAMGAVHVSAFAHGLLYGLNYSASFIILQHCHLVLATKQPAMTAATLAGAMRDLQGPERLDALEGITVRIVHSQFAAAYGNILAVAVGAFLFDALWRLTTGGHYLDAEQARAIYLTLSPVDSLTVLYAAETGVILWMASIAGGWADNLARLHRLPLALRDRGRPGLANALERHLAGWATNIGLGMMLGFAPVIGEFFGLPIDVRHVTLSTGMLSLAVAGHPDWWSAGTFLAGAAGIVVMFVLNLGVSFGLSLATALPAYGLPLEDIRGLLSRLGRRLLRRPWDFLVPTAGAPSPAARSGS